jgi:peptidyl-tRNA hydrolase, PTH1 family
VLNDFAKAEQPWVEDLCSAIASHAALLGKDDALFANRVHVAMEKAGHAEAKTPREAGRAKKAGQGEEPR